MLVEKSLSWSSTTQRNQVSTTTQLLWLLDTQDKSEHSQVFQVFTWGIFGNSKRKSSHISMRKISTASTLSKLSLATQLDIYSPGSVNLHCYAQAA